MSKLPRVSGVQVVRALERLGFVRLRQSGSHVIMRRESKGCVVPNAQRSQGRHACRLAAPSASLTGRIRAGPTRMTCSENGAEPTRARSFTLAVSSIEEQAAHLEKLNIDTRQRTSGEKVKTLMITDPDGNHIAFAEAIDPGLAR